MEHGRQHLRTFVRAHLCRPDHFTGAELAWLELAQLLGLDVHDTERPPPGELAGPTCETPGCGRSIPPGGEGVPETCPACLDETKHGAS